MATKAEDNSMDTHVAQNIQTIPEGYHTVTPWIIVKGAAQLIEYLKAAFDAEEIARVVNPDGAIGHAEIRIGDSIVMLFDAKAEWNATPAFIRLYVENGDAVHQRALEAGGTSVTEMTMLGFGDRVGRIRDPFGNIWWIQTRIEELNLQEMERRASDPTFKDAMQYVEESLDSELSSRKGHI
ncbi:MAG TPA: VOC family protein [Phototrophicaceae bacterium]|nr:VOC family protein [Phototrophicaceae bacterium]